MIKRLKQLSVAAALTALPCAHIGAMAQGLTANEILIGQTAGYINKRGTFTQ